MDMQQKVNNVIIVNSNSVKQYNNVNLSIQQVINNITKNLKNKSNIKKLENFYFKYKKQYNNLEEKLQDDTKLRQIFLDEFEKLLKDVKKEEKEFILKQTKKNLIKSEELDYTNPVNLLFLQLPLFLLNKTTNTLILINSNVTTELKNNFIKQAEQQLKINIKEIDEKEYLTQQQKFINNIKGKKINEILKQTQQQQNINIDEILEENRKLKEENAKIKKLANRLIKETEKLENNLQTLEEFIEKDVIQLVYLILNTKKQEQKEELQKELQLKMTQKPTFTTTLSM